MQVVLPMLLDDLVKTSCDNSVTPPVCTDDPATSWVTTTQFYTGLGLVQVQGEEGEGLYWPAACAGRRDPSLKGGGGTCV